MSDPKATPKTVPEPKTASVAPPQPIYPVGEFIANAKALFGASRDLATAAFRVSGKMECTQAEAREIIEKFRKRKV